MGAPAGSGPPPPRRFHDFQDLMHHRIMDILLVASPYDTFILEEAGQLSERLLGEFRNLDLHYGPGLTGAANGAEALDLIRKQPRRFDLIITTAHVGDMTALELARRIKAEGLDVPIVLLAWDTQELGDPGTAADRANIDRPFLWQGDARLLVGIVKYLEDKLNVAHDTRAVGVQVIILIEDNVRYYSSFLPTIYNELLHHSQRVIAEGLNLSQKILRMRARPKILLCGTYEEAWAAFTSYEEEVLGVISDIDFPRAGRRSPEAGVDFARRIREPYPDIPVILQSSRAEYAALARSLGAAFLLKGSPVLLNDLRRYMLQDFGFGDFVFRTPEGAEVDRASDLRSLGEKLGTVREESVVYHAARNHFSKWLKARTEFALAHELRPRKISDFATGEELRQSLIRSIADYRRAQAQSTVADFERGSFDPSGDFYRIGGGSLGGKARGLAFVRRLLDLHGVRDRFPGVRVSVPPAVVVATDVFDRFLEENSLRAFAVESGNDAEVERRFVDAPFPEEAAQDLAAFLEKVRYPLAVRSSSILEDSQHQPFTGVYETLMLPNNAWSLADRLGQVLDAVKRVYASTFSQHAQAYIRATPYRIEEEKMAVILQKIVGSPCGPRFYPDFSGVARSHNFYPVPPLTAGDGIVAVALGLGRGIAEGGACLRFCPRYPRHVPQFSSVSDMLESAQREFWAVALEKESGEENIHEVSYGLEVAEADGTLASLGSTYSPENDAVYDGLSRHGVRVVTFAPVLKHGLFPLAEVLDVIMGMGAAGMGGPVEIEFAVDLRPPPGQPREFGFLQMRPLALSRETEELELGEVREETVLCRSRRVLGNGRIEGIRDLVVVDFQRFERARSPEAASEVGRLNAELLDHRTPYLLIGVGRWGSRDPWLGIPVTWDQVSGAQTIVEAGLRDLKVTPSQGTHFFQNLTSFNVGYFTVNPESGDGFLDWEWLDAQPALSQVSHVRHLRLAQPILVKMNGRRNEGLILKPSA
jgi:CheY-like chemotaxis protein